MNVCVIGDVETVAGFALAGVKETYEVKTEKEAAEALEKSEATIVIVNEEFIGDYRHPTRVIVRIARDGKASAEVLSSIVKNALGFDIKL